MRPDFFVIGAAKAASTSLCDLISSHPDVYFCPGKECGFFTYNWDRGFDWYESLFAAGSSATAVGEGSTTYSQTGVWPHAAERLASASPDARIVYIVREPLARMQSHWIQWRVEGRIGAGPFVEAVRNVPALLDASLYWKQISAYRAHFPRERILVLFIEDFTTSPELVVRRVFDFLGLDRDVPLEDVHRVANPSHLQRAPRWTGRWIRKLPGYARLRDALPFWLRRPFSPFLSTPFTERPLWDEATRQWVLERVGPDAKRFLESYGKPEDYWPDLTLPTALD